nr:MAG TPA: hypothetical protein [Bacteriophage sp.]
MSKLLESLENYFKNTPKEQLDKDWKEIEYLNEIGPDVFETLGVNPAKYIVIYTDTYLDKDGCLQEGNFCEIVSSLEKLEKFKKVHENCMHVFELGKEIALNYE